MERPAEVSVTKRPRCSRCRRSSLEGADFYRNRHHRSGWQNDCIDCRARFDRPSRASVPGGHSIEFHGKTLKEIGAELGITAERVRQIEARALRKLASNARVLRVVRKLLEGRD